MEVTTSKMRYVRLLWAPLTIAVADNHENESFSEFDEGNKYRDSCTWFIVNWENFASVKEEKLKKKRYLILDNNFIHSLG